MIEHYFASIRVAVRAITTARVSYYLERAEGSQVVLLRFRLSWPSGQLLQVAEVLREQSSTVVWLRYRYHFQSNTLVLRYDRYDNAPHYPELPTHPEHRHLNQVTEAATRPSLLSFLDEVRQASGLW